MSDSETQQALTRVGFRSSTQPTNLQSDLAGFSANQYEQGYLSLGDGHRWAALSYRWGRSRRVHNGSNTLSSSVHSANLK